jgi:thiol-disulfide isomerase/thioredoxin
MNRRRALLALGGLGLTGTSAWVLQSDVGGSDDALPMRVETLDAPGSTAGTTSVPPENTVTLVDLFATWCAPCEEQMVALTAIRETYGDEVAMLSVTNERLGGSLTKADLRGWWRDHDGAWTLGLDPASDLMSALGAGSIPHLAIFDAAGEVSWQEGGLTDEETLRTEIDRALEKR